MTPHRSTLAKAALVIIAICASFARAPAAEAPPRELRIGYRKSVGALLIAKDRGELAKRLTRDGRPSPGSSFNRARR